MAGLLEGADVSHVSSPCSLFPSPRPSRPRWRSKAEGDRRRIRLGRSAAEDGGGETFLPREEWRRSRQGKKVERRPLRLGDRGVAGLRPDQAINETEWCALPGTEKSEENPATIIGPRPQTPATRKSFALLEPLAPGSRNSTPVYPDRRFCRASIGTPAPNRTTSRTHPSGHDAHRAWLLLRSKLESTGVATSD